MKKGIHPKYFKNAVAVCSCGEEFKISSTKEKINIELCSKCHPFYTGKQKLVDTAGRVDKFKLRLERAKNAVPKKPKKRKRKIIEIVDKIEKDDKNESKGEKKEKDNKKGLLKEEKTVNEIKEEEKVEKDQ